MLLLEILLLGSTASLWFGNVFAEDQCIFFETNARLVPGKDGFNATLAFTVNDTCKATNSSLKSVKIVKKTQMNTRPEILGQIFYKNESTFRHDGCSYDEQTSIFSMTRSTESDKGETWMLVGEMHSGYRFNSTVDISLTITVPDDPQRFTLVQIVAASAGVVILILIIILVKCARKKTSRDQPRRSRSQPDAEGECSSCPDPVDLAADLDPVYSEGAAADPQLSPSQPDVDEDGYTSPDFLLAAESPKHGSDPQYKNSQVFREYSNTLRPGTRKFDDDGYISQDAGNTEGSETPAARFYCNKDAVPTVFLQLGM